MNVNIKTIVPLLAILILSACAGPSIKPQNVIDAFKAAGLEAEKTRAMKPDDYGMAPLGDEGIRFYIPSLCKDCGGRVIYYEDAAYLNKAKDYYTKLGKENAALFSWVFVKGNVIVQINGKMPEEQAKKYQSALETAGD